MKRSLPPLALALALASGIACADDPIQWNGYFNLVGGVLRDAPRIDTSGLEQRPGYDAYDNHFSVFPQSSGAIQGRKIFNDTVSFTAQLYGERDAGDYRARLNWLYATYTPDEHSTFRIGRIGVPIYYYSDFLTVGFTYPWVSLPHEIYKYDTSNDGVDYVFRDFHGALEYSAEVFSGFTHQSLPDLQSNVRAHNRLGLASSLVYDGWLTVRASAVDAMVSVHAVPLNADAMLDSALDTAKTLVPGVDDSVWAALKSANLERLADKIAMEDVHTLYADLFMRADLDRWLLTGERTVMRTHDYMFGTNQSWYVTGGYRLTPDCLVHLTYSASNGSVSHDARQDSFAPLQNLAAAIGSNAAAISILNRHAVSLGTRFDTSANTAVKFEVTRFHDERSLPGESMGVGDNLLFRTALNVSF